MSLSYRELRSEQMKDPESKAEREALEPNLHIHRVVIADEGSDTSDDQEAEAYRKEIIDHIARFDIDKLLKVLVAIDDIEFEPNAETIAAMEAERDPNEKLYDSFDDLLAEVRAEMASSHEI